MQAKVMIARFRTFTIALGSVAPEAIDTLADVGTNCVVTCGLLVAIMKQVQIVVSFRTLVHI